MRCIQGLVLVDLELCLRPHLFLLLLYLLFDHVWMIHLFSIAFIDPMYPWMFEVTSSWIICSSPHHVSFFVIFRNSICLSCFVIVIFWTICGICFWVWSFVSITFPCFSEFGELSSILSLELCCLLFFSFTLLSLYFWNCCPASSWNRFAGVNGFTLHKVSWLCDLCLLRDVKLSFFP